MECKQLGTLGLYLRQRFGGQHDGQHRRRRLVHALLAAPKRGQVLPAALSEAMDTTMCTTETAMPNRIRQTIRQT